MTFWDFADRQMSRINARTVAGGGVFALTTMIFIMVWVSPELADSDLFKTLAQAIVVQGLVGLAIAFWFTAKEDDGPSDVRVTNEPTEPVPVDNETEKGAIE